MAYTFKDLQDEVSARAVRDESGGQFTTQIKNVINTSLFRLAREAHWTTLRRKDESIETEGEITSGTVSATKDSKSMTGSSINLLTNGVEKGRRIDVQGSSISFIIDTITGENAWTVTRAYDGTTASSLTFKIYGREDYTFPMQLGRVAFVWHEKFGRPYILRYISDFSFFGQRRLSGGVVNTSATPTHYRMWGEDDVLQQPYANSVLRVLSSDSNDTSRSITIWGKVSGFPDFETIVTNSSDGTTAVSGSKTFDAGSIERVAKDSSTIGRITVDANSADVIVATLPVGDVTGRVAYKHFQLWPLPQDVFPLMIWYYKDPWRLVNDVDFHELGPEFDESVILLAVAKIKYQNSQVEGDRFFSMYRDEIRSLRRKNADKLDEILELLRPREESQGTSSFIHPQLSFNQLGGQFGPMGF